MYRLQGPQTGPFENISPGGKSINILGGELMAFDPSALLWGLKTWWNLLSLRARF